MYNTKVEFVLCLFLGWAGVHRFYRKKWGSGFVWLFTLGLFGVGWAVDLIRLLLSLIGKQKTAEPEDRSLKKEDFYIVGTDYYTSNIEKLSCSNPDWKRNTAQLRSKNLIMKKIYRYSYVNKPIKLIPENNPHDENAVMVMIAGEKVGYISKEENIKVRSILQGREIKYISAFISGGEYKVVSDNGDSEKLTENFRIRVRIAYV